MPTHELPLALADRRAELQRAIDADNEAAEHLRDKIKEVLHNRDDARAELRGIDLAAEAYAAGVVAQELELLGNGHGEAAEKHSRRPRRDIRAMVREEVERNGWQHHMDSINPAAIASSIGCRVAQVEAALRLMPPSPNGGEE